MSSRRARFFVSFRLGRSANRQTDEIYSLFWIYCTLLIAFISGVREFVYFNVHDGCKVSCLYLRRVDFLIWQIEEGVRSRIRRNIPRFIFLIEVGRGRRLTPLPFSIWSARLGIFFLDLQLTNANNCLLAFFFGSSAFNLCKWSEAGLTFKTSDQWQISCRKNAAEQSSSKHASLHTLSHLHCVFCFRFSAAPSHYFRFFKKAANRLNELLSEVDCCFFTDAGFHRNIQADRYSHVFAWQLLCANPMTFFSCPFN